MVPPKRSAASDDPVAAVRQRQNNFRQPHRRNFEERRKNPQSWRVGRGQWPVENRGGRALADAFPDARGLQGFQLATGHGPLATIPQLPRRYSSSNPGLLESRRNGWRQNHCLHSPSVRRNRNASGHSQIRLGCGAGAGCRDRRPSLGSGQTRRRAGQARPRTGQGHRPRHLPGCLRQHGWADRLGQAPAVGHRQRTGPAQANARTSASPSTATGQPTTHQTRAGSARKSI